MNKFNRKFILILLFAISFNANNVLADPPKVICVPWISQMPSIPHDTYGGAHITLKAVVYNSSNSLYNYSWDFGNGTLSSEKLFSNEVVDYEYNSIYDAYNIETKATYSGSVGSNFTAKLIVWNDSGYNFSDEYYIEVKEETNETKVNIAIDEGLWYLHKQMNRGTYDGEYGGYWTTGSYTISPTATAVMAFEKHSHLPDGNMSEDPYVFDVTSGLNYLFSNMYIQSISSDSNCPLGNPDTNNNGYGIGVSSAKEIYEFGPTMLAVVFARNKSLVAQVGDVAGMTYFDIVQDMADMASWGQSEGGYTGTDDDYEEFGNEENRGGWRYSWNSLSSDISTTKWPMIGLMLGEKEWDINISNWVKTELYNYIYYSAIPDGDGTSGFGYGVSSTGSTLARTASGLNCLMFTEDYTSDMYYNGLNYIKNRWNNYDETDWYVGSKTKHLYDMVALYDMISYFRDEIERYLEADIYDFFANEILLEKQNIDGSFPNGYRFKGDQPTANALYILRKTVDIPIYVRESNFPYSPISNADVRVYKDGEIIASGKTDISGKFSYSSVDESFHYIIPDKIEAYHPKYKTASTYDVLKGYIELEKVPYTWVNEHWPYGISVNVTSSVEKQDYEVGVSLISYGVFSKIGQDAIINTDSIRVFECTEDGQNLNEVSNYSIDDKLNVTWTIDISAGISKYYNIYFNSLSGGLLPAEEDKQLLYLKFDERSGNFVNDSSVHKTNGTISGATWINDKYGWGLQFDGEDDYVDIVDTEGINLGGPWTDRTTSVWFKTSDDITSTQIIYEEGGNERGFNIYIEGGKLWIGGYNERGVVESDWQGTWFSTSISQNCWYHAVLKLEDAEYQEKSDKFMAYLNGERFGIGSGARVYQHPGDIGIGRMDGGGILNYVENAVDSGFYFNGTISEVRMFDDSLSDGEIKALYLSKSLILDLKMDQEAGNIANDSSGFQNNGILYNMNDNNWVEGKYGNALEVDGVDDYVNFGDFNLDSSDNFSFCLWFNGSYGQYGSIFLKGHTSDSYGFDLGDTTVRFGIRGDQSYSRIVAPFDENQWHYFVGVHEAGNKISIYYDGELVGTDSIPTLGEVTSGEIGFGDSDRLISSRVGNISGSIDEVKIFGRALSASEIKNLYSKQGYRDLAGGIRAHNLQIYDTWNYFRVYDQLGQVLPNTEAVIEDSSGEIVASTISDLSGDAYCEFPNPKENYNITFYNIVHNKSIVSNFIPTNHPYGSEITLDRKPNSKVSGDWHSWLSINVSAPDIAQMDAIAEYTVNFSNKLGSGKTFDPNSIRILEYDFSGNIIYPGDTLSGIPYIWNNVSLDKGTLIWTLNGTMDANSNRSYRIYFDIMKEGFAPKHKSSYEIASVYFNQTKQEIFEDLTSNGLYVIENEKIKFFLSNPYNVSGSGVYSFGSPVRIWTKDRDNEISNSSYYREDREILNYMNFTFNSNFINFSSFTLYENKIIADAGTIGNFSIKIIYEIYEKVNYVKITLQAENIDTAAHNARFDVYGDLFGSNYDGNITAYDSSGGLINESIDDGKKSSGSTWDADTWVTIFTEIGSNPEYNDLFGFLLDDNTFTLQSGENCKFSISDDNTYSIAAGNSHKMEFYLMSDYRGDDQYWDSAEEGSSTVTENVTPLEVGFDTNPPPIFSDINVSPQDPIAYDYSRIYQFNITVSDDDILHTVLFELNNSSGYSTNYSVNIIDSYFYSFNLGNLDAGNYTYRWHFIDSAYNKVSTPFHNYSIVKSSSSVSLEIDDVFDNKSIQGGDSFEITISPPTVLNDYANLYVNFSGTLELIYSGIAPYTYVNSTEVLDLPLGTYKIFANYSGNKNFLPSNKTLFLTVIDTKSPDLDIITSSGQYNSNFELIVDVDDYTLDKVWFTIDGGEKTYLNPPYFNDTIDIIGGWQEGETKVIEVWANDSKNLDSFAQISITKDTVVFISLLDPINNNTKINSSKLEVFYNTDASDLSGGYVKIHLGGIVERDYTLATQSYTIDNIPEGVHALYIEVKDDAGNINTSKVIYILVDLTPPSIYLTSIENNSKLNVQDFTLEYQLDSAEEVKIYIDSQIYIDSDKDGYFEVSNLDEGSHQIRIQARDDFGNINLSDIFYFSIDLNPPLFSDVSVDSNFSTYYVPQRSYKISCNWNDSVSLSQVILEFNGHNYTVPTHIGNNYFYYFSNLDAGSHSIRWYAKDSHGNWNFTSYYYLNISKVGSLDSDDSVFDIFRNIYFLLILVAVLSATVGAVVYKKRRKDEDCSGSFDTSQAVGLDESLFGVLGGSREEEEDKFYGSILDKVDETESKKEKKKLKKTKKKEKDSDKDIFDMISDQI